VQIAQILRRVAWRTRRRFVAGVDNAPIVTVEGATTTNARRRRWPVSATLLVLGVLALGAFFALPR
jgi:hypothetical protein